MTRISYFYVHVEILWNSCSAFSTNSSSSVVNNNSRESMTTKKQIHLIFAQSLAATAIHNPFVCDIFAQGLGNMLLLILFTSIQNSELFRKAYKARMRRYFEQSHHVKHNKKQNEKIRKSRREKLGKKLNMKNNNEQKRKHGRKTKSDIKKFYREW